jgi:type II secretory pathway component PulC
MLKPPPRVSIRGTRTARAQHSPQAAFSKAELERAIHPTGPHAYDVERSLLKAAVARAGQLARTTRLAPVRHFSAVSGMQINALAESGLLAHLGLMRGDLVKSLNGVPLTGLVDMLRAQTLLTSTPRLSLLIMRQGVPFALDYHLVD